MHYYLRQHPEIFMSLPKEPFYFGSDLDSHQLKTHDRDEYLSFFEQVDSEKYVGESTVWYLYSRQAAAEIKHFATDPRILIMLRNPVDAMHAMHSQFLFSGNETIEDFQRAVEAEPRRRQTRQVDPAVYFPDGLLYTRVFSYYSQVKRYFEVFEPNQLKVILLKDLKRDPEDCYRSVLNFLNVKRYRPTQFEPHNTNCQLRSQVLRDIVRQFPGHALGTLRDFVPVQPCVTLWQHVKPFLIDKFSRKPIDPNFRKKLIKQFKPGIRRLETLIDRDLSHWTNGD